MEACGLRSRCGIACLHRARTPFTFTPVLQVPVGLFRQMHRAVGRGPVRAARHRTGVVHQDVEPAKRLGRKLDQGLISARFSRSAWNDLAMAYMNKAVALGDLGDHRAAVEFYEKAIQIYERLVAKEGRAELANDLAMAFMNKANALDALGEPRAAMDFYDHTILIYEQLVVKEGRSELVHGLAAAYMNKAIALRALGTIGQR